jgi:hypothetical protein
MANNSNQIELVVTVEVDKANQSIKSVNANLSGIEQTAVRAARGASQGIDGMTASMIKGATAGNLLADAIKKAIEWAKEWTVEAAKDAAHTERAAVVARSLAKAHGDGAGLPKIKIAGQPGPEDLKRQIEVQKRQRETEKYFRDQVIGSHPVSGFAKEIAEINKEVASRTLYVDDKGEHQIPLTKKAWDAVIEYANNKLKAFLGHAAGENKKALAEYLIGNTFKTAMLTAIKEVVTSRVAALLMQMFTGQKVTFAGGGAGPGGSGGILGGLGGLLGIGAAPVFGSTSPGGGVVPGGAPGSTPPFIPGGAGGVTSKAGAANLLNFNWSNIKSLASWKNLYSAMALGGGLLMLSGVKNGSGAQHHRRRRDWRRGHRSVRGCHAARWRLGRCGGSGGRRDVRVERRRSPGRGHRRGRWRPRRRLPAVCEGRRGEGPPEDQGSIRRGHLRQGGDPADCRHRQADLRRQHRYGDPDGAGARPVPVVRHGSADQRDACDHAGAQHRAAGRVALPGAELF